MFKMPWTNYHELNLDWILDIIQNLSKRVKAIEETYDPSIIEGLFERLAAVEEKANSHDIEIAALQDELESIETDISNIETALENHETRIETLEEDVAELKTEVENHETRIEALEQGGGGDLPEWIDYSTSATKRQETITATDNDTYDITYDENGIMNLSITASGQTTPGNVIVRGIRTPVNNSDAANKQYVDSHGGLPDNVEFTADSGNLYYKFGETDADTGNRIEQIYDTADTELTFNSYKTGQTGSGNVRLKGLLTPIDNSDAATKKYVDDHSGGLPSNIDFTVSGNDLTYKFGKTSADTGDRIEQIYDTANTELTLNSYKTGQSGSGNVRLKGLLTPVDNNDAATKKYVDDNSGNLPNWIEYSTTSTIRKESVTATDSDTYDITYDGNGVMNLAVTASGQSTPGNVLVRGIRTPINNSDAANKQYVDEHGGGGSLPEWFHVEYLEDDDTYMLWFGGDLETDEPAAIMYQPSEKSFAVVPTSGSADAHFLVFVDPVDDYDVATKKYVDDHGGSGGIPTWFQFLNQDGYHGIEFQNNLNAIYDIRADNTENKITFVKFNSEQTTPTPVKLSNVAAPSSGSDAANKAYVDAAIEYIDTTLQVEGQSPISNPNRLRIYYQKNSNNQRLLLSFQFYNSATLGSGLILNDTDTTYLTTITDGALLSSVGSVFYSQIYSGSSSSFRTIRIHPYFENGVIKIGIRKLDSGSVTVPVPYVLNMPAMNGLN